MKVKIKKIYGSWFLVDQKTEELLESYDSRMEAENALWDLDRPWVSLWDVEREANGKV